MTEPLRPSIGTRVMAFLCRVCPLCVPARRWPVSHYARKIRVVQERCPCCGARVEVKRYAASPPEKVVLAAK